jgi:hypothetical protein
MNITDYKNTNDWFYIIPAAILVDFIVIVLAKLPKERPYFGVDALNAWYDRFGTFAVLSDVTSLLIGIAAARYIYTSLNLNNPLYFIATLLAFQLFHDLFFFTAVITPIKKGHNAMIDVFKSYAKENGAKILVADALMLIGSVLIASVLKSIPDHFTVSVSLITLYALCYIIYTK